MAIDLHNYEAYLLDFFEGRLSAAEVAGLQAFVLAHPELQIDLNESSLPVVETPNDTISTFSLRKDLPGEDEKVALEYVEGLMGPDEKEKFSKLLTEKSEMRELVKQYEATRFTPGAEQLDRTALLIDEPTAPEAKVLEYREGLMNAQEQLEFERLMDRDADLSHLNRQFASCKIEADRSIVFENKENLMRSPRVISLRSNVLRAAASIVFIAMLTILMWQATDDTGSRMASNSVSTQSTIEPRSDVAEPLPAAVAANEESAETSDSKSSVTVKKQQKQRPVIKRKTPLIVPDTEQEQQIAEVVKVERAGEVEQSDLSEVTAPSQPVARASNQDTVTGTVVYGLENLAVVEDEPVNAGRNGFWEKAARVAKQMGKLGVKGVEADTGNNSVTLSLNELSVEKKYARL